MARLAMAATLAMLCSTAPSRVEAEELGPFPGPRQQPNADCIWYPGAMTPFCGLPPVVQAANCDSYRVTGYVRGQGSGWTYDGTSEYTREAIAAASWNVPIDAKVQVDGVGTFRVADRGNLSARHIDVLVDSVSEAYALTRTASACWWME